MEIPRRTLLTGMIGLAPGAKPMERYGSFGKLTAQPGQRDELLKNLLLAADLVKSAPGCEIYIVSTSPTEVDAVWVTEVWRSEADHAASLTLDRVKDLIKKTRPIIAGMEATLITPIGGVGLHTE